VAAWQKVMISGCCFSKLDLACGTKSVATKKG
jgi:hypothetical protein